MTAKISTPKIPEPSEDVMGPNHVSTTDPGFDSSYRDSAGDVGSTTRVAGRRPEAKVDEFGFPRSTK